MTRCLGGAYRTESELRELGFHRIGRNVRVHERASIYGLENISLGDNVRIDDFSVIIATGPLEVGNHVSIHNFCFLGARAGIYLEDFVTLAPGSKLFSASDDYSGVWLTGPVVPRALTGGKSAPVILRKHTIIGAGSVILPGCTIGEGCAVGALSLVIGDLNPWGIYAGIPVSRRKERRKELLALEAQMATPEPK